MTRRPDEVFVRFEIRPVGDLGPGLESAPSNGREFVEIVKRDSKGQSLLGVDGKPIKERVKAYEGKTRPLAYLAPATTTNDVRVTTRRAPFRTTFTNGILAAQWLRNVLNENGVIERNELYEKIVNPADPHRKYLSGDVIPLIHELFKRKGTFYLSLYELEDEELEEILIDNAARIHVILANTGVGEDKKWDARNKAGENASWTLKWTSNTACSTTVPTSVTISSWCTCRQGAVLAPSLPAAPIGLRRAWRVRQTMRC